MSEKPVHRVLTAAVSFSAVYQSVTAMPRTETILGIE